MVFDLKKRGNHRLRVKNKKTSFSNSEESSAAVVAAAAAAAAATITSDDDTRTTSSSREYYADESIISLTTGNHTTTLTEHPSCFQAEQHERPKPVKLVSVPKYHPVRNKKSATTFQGTVLSSLGTPAPRAYSNRFLAMAPPSAALDTNNNNHYTTSTAATAIPKRRPDGLLRGTAAAASGQGLNTSSCSSSGVGGFSRNFSHQSLSTLPATNVTQPLVCLSLLPTAALSSSSSPKDLVTQSVKDHLHFYPQDEKQQEYFSSRQQHQQSSEWLGHLALLSVAAGNTDKARNYSQKAVQQARNERPLVAARALGIHGVVLCCCCCSGNSSNHPNNKLPLQHAPTSSPSKNPLDAWREATQLSCVAVGYEHAHVALLLNNIGVWHAQQGEKQSAVAALQESLGLQRNLLKRTPQQLELALYPLATTMGNLAVVQQSTDMLQECRTIFMSLEATPPDLLHLVDTAMDRIEHDYEDDGQSVATNDSLESIRSASLFGNSDGIPNQAAARLSLELIMADDFVALGPLHPPWTSAARIHETVLSWIGQDDDDDDQFANNKESIPVDLDAQMVPNAELRLQEIHLQTYRHLRRGETADALDLLENALRSHTIKYGPSHHLVGSAWHKMGIVHLAAQQYDAAWRAFTKAVSIRTQALGANHPGVQESQMKIVLVLLARHELIAAYNLLEEIQGTYLEIAGHAHGQIPLVIHNMGVVWAEHGDWQEAYKNFELAYEYQRRRCEDSTEEESPLMASIVITLSNMAYCQYQQGHVLEALNLYEVAEEMPGSAASTIQVLRRNIAHLVGQGGGCTPVEDPVPVMCGGVDDIWRPFWNWAAETTSRCK